MTDLQRRGLIADLTRRLALAAHDELRVVDAILVRLELGRDRYGELDLAKPRDWRKERREEQLDAVIYDVADQLAADDRALTNLRDAASAELLEWQSTPTVASSEPARIALADIEDADPYAEWDVSDVVGGEGG